ncbi:MAG: hypothetical protein VW338_15535 [Rhodospirillaceae bacterium]
MAPQTQTADAGHLRTRTGPKDAQLRKARVCYNQLAGDMGTQLFDRLMARRLISADGDDLVLTKKGDAFAREFGIYIDGLRAAKAPLCRKCLDWSERRSHLAGSLGRALLTRFEALGWAKRDPATRVVNFSKTGERRFAELFNR